ncbi:MAG TPA: AAA family ATPase [Pyrinomonadaceae bacterium]|nr:AAA family ATPase [Pyrinomonadaceae bacterium]
MHFEDAAAAVFTRKPLIQSLPREEAGGAGSAVSPLTENARLERFIYHPEEMEGSWLAKRPGSTYGTSSIVTAQIVRHELEPSTYSLCTALMRALAAMKVNQECGGGDAHEFRADIPTDELKRVFHQNAGSKSSSRAGADMYNSYAAAYCTAFSHDIFSDPQLKSQPPGTSNLLRDLTGAGFEYVAAKATEIVIRGWEQALKFAPKARYGKYLTADRGEIEKINEIRSMILSYRSNLDDRQPLSIAVFGPPGSGKSFAIKQLAAELFGEDQSTVEFNLSQFGESGEDLHTAFHRVRDASVQGQIPLVFWDEFDSQGMKWLREFLMPLQDAKFQAGSLVYPFGKSIFIFAGGTHFNFEEFDKSEAADDAGKKFRSLKGPDFVSRLRGYINIKGPNPQKLSTATAESHQIFLPGDASDGALPIIEEAQLQDVEHLIRRAILLRSALERYHGNLIDHTTKFAFISPSVIRGFLRVKKFLHGARSLEALVNMSALADSNYFGVAELPSPDLLRLHVTKDFLEQVHEGQVLAPALEALASEYYERSLKVAPSGQRPARESAPAAQPTRFSELSEVLKEEWRVLARLLPAKLLDLGYRIVPRGAVARESQRKIKLNREELGRLRQIEHDIWLRTHLLKGYERGVKNDVAGLLHRNIVAFDGLTGGGESLDEAVAENLPNLLWKNGYILTKG